MNRSLRWIRIGFAASVGWALALTLGVVFLQFLGLFEPEDIASLRELGSTGYDLAYHVIEYGSIALRVCFVIIFAVLADPSRNHRSVASVSFLVSTGWASWIFVAVYRDLGVFFWLESCLVMATGLLTLLFFLKSGSQNSVTV